MTDVAAKELHEGILRASFARIQETRDRVRAAASERLADRADLDGTWNYLERIRQHMRADPIVAITEPEEEKARGDEVSLTFFARD